MDCEAFGQKKNEIEQSASTEEVQFMDPVAHTRQHQKETEDYFAARDAAKVQLSPLKDALTGAIASTVTDEEFYFVFHPIHMLRLTFPE